MGKVAGFLGFGFEKVAGFLRFGKHKSKDVPAQVVVDRPPLGPVLTPSISGDGGIQGLGWYLERLRMDEDGDVAEEFLDEVSSEKTEGHAVDHLKTQARFKQKNGTKSVRAKKPILLDGKIIPQIVEPHQGRL